MAQSSSTGTLYMYLQQIAALDQTQQLSHSSNLQEAMRCLINDLLEAMHHHEVQVYDFWRELCDPKNKALSRNLLYKDFVTLQKILLHFKK